LATLISRAIVHTPHWARLKSIQNEPLNAYLSEHLISVVLKTRIVLPIPSEAPKIRRGTAISPFSGTRFSELFTTLIIS
jgi:hypothetical protein